MRVQGTLRACRSAAVALATALGAAGQASGQAERADSEPVRITHRWTELRPADAPAPQVADAELREQLGRLAFARVTLESEGAELRRVLREVRRTLGLNMIVFEQRASRGGLVEGIDGDLPIDISLVDADGYAVLDALAAVAGADVTWQMNGGLVEFGRKSRLARSEARRTRVFDVSDLALIAPDYRPEDGGQSYNRLDSDEVLADLVRNIATHCEPAAFEPAPEREHDDAAAPTGAGRGGGVSGPSKTRARTNPGTNAARNLDPKVGPIYVHGKWASIQTRDMALVVVAPDFVMRRIDGYPKPLPPRASAEPAK
ncbi:MAG: hypothetical protein RL136_234 [Planctomycetota bacterium]|jgi:hypothetical protein